MTFTVNGYFCYMATIYGVINQKGGVGKTSLVQNVGFELARAEHPTLLVDLDPQSNLTQGFGLQPGDMPLTIYDAMQNPEDAAETVQQVRPNLGLIPANLFLAGAEKEFGQAAFGRTTRLRDVLDVLKGQYSYIFIDSPPSLGFFTVNALTAADKVIIPMECEYYAYLMIEPVMKFIQEARKENPGLTVSAIVPTKYDSRTSLSDSVLKAARNTYGSLVTETIIPRNVRIGEAPIEGKSVYELERTSSGAVAYGALTEELVKHG